MFITSSVAIGSRLATGKLVGPAPGLIAQANPRQQPLRQHEVVAPPQVQQAAQPRALGQPTGQHVGQHRQAPDQVEMLEHHGHAAAHLPQGGRPDVDTVEQNLPALNAFQPIKGTQQGRLARPGRPEDRDKTSGLDVQRDVLEGFMAVVIALADVVELKHRHRRPLT
nr:hypothetical protein [Pseudomonas sp. R5(2019)]